MAEVVSKHFTATINIEKVLIIRSEEPDGPRLDKREQRRVGSVVKLTLTSKSLEHLLSKVAAHVAIIDIDEDITTEVDNSHIPGKRGL